MLSLSLSLTLSLSHSHSHSLSLSLSLSLVQLSQISAKKTKPGPSFQPEKWLHDLHALGTALCKIPE